MLRVRCLAGCGCACHDVFVCARCRLCVSVLCRVSVDARSRVVARFRAPWCNGLPREIAWRVYVSGVSLCKRLFVVVPLVAWLRVCWLCVASPNVIASRSGGLASVAFCMYSLCARRDVARVYLWNLSCECLYPVKSLSRSCVRRTFYEHSAGFRLWRSRSVSRKLSEKRRGGVGGL